MDDFDADFVFGLVETGPDDARDVESVVQDEVVFGFDTVNERHLVGLDEAVEDDGDLDGVLVLLRAHVELVEVDTVASGVQGDLASGVDQANLHAGLARG